MAIAHIYLEYKVVTGLFELERYNNAYLGAEECKSKWIFATVLNLINLVLVWIPIINIIGMVVAVIMNIVFLVSVNTFKNNYYAMKNSREN